MNTVLVQDNKSADTRNDRIEQQEIDLASLKEDMRYVLEFQERGNEELQLANEEITSSNEELQSLHEELETNRGEIECANEEILTSNKQLQFRSDQLPEAYCYSEAILSTMTESTLNARNIIHHQRQEAALLISKEITEKDNDRNFLMKRPA